MTQPDDCVFCHIVAGTAGAEIVLDDDDAVAFLDIRPLFVGHALLVPRNHHETLVDLPPGEIEPFFLRVRRLTAAIGRALDAPGTFVAMNNTVSQSVPHLHVHVVPRRPKDGLRGFFWPRSKYDGDPHLRETGAAIRSALAALPGDADIAG